MEMECILPREVTCTKKCHAVDFFFLIFKNLQFYLIFILSPTKCFTTQFGSQPYSDKNRIVFSSSANQTQTDKLDKLPLWEAVTTHQPLVFVVFHMQNLWLLLMSRTCVLSLLTGFITAWKEGHWQNPYDWSPLWKPLWACWILR